MHACVSQCGYVGVRWNYRWLWATLCSAENRTQVFCKSIMNSPPVTHLSSPGRCFLRSCALLSHRQWVLITSIWCLGIHLEYKFNWSKALSPLSISRWTPHLNDTSQWPETGSCLTDCVFSFPASFKGTIQVLAGAIKLTVTLLP